ncbi:MAG: tRNA pseudouridine(55) synthase TruB [Candidatus Saccharimonadales bacterium]
MMTDGTVLIDKPSHMTSFGVVARVRRVLTQNAGKKIKVGHTGTLDPFATGLMILVIGKECKNAGSYSKLDKTYEATIRLGISSSTGDPEGNLTEVSDIIPTEKHVIEALRGFEGEIQQTPPTFSAIKINGQRAYKLARAGEVVEMPVRTVTVYSIELVEYNYPYVRINTHVSSGTYIRTLAEDIGGVLKTGAYCTELRRTSISSWTLAQAQTLQEFGVTDDKPVEKS